MKTSLISNSLIGVLLLIATFASAQKKTSEKILEFDTSSVEIKKRSGKLYDLDKKKSYRFKITTMNSAYHKVVFKVDQVSKDVTAPDVIKGFIQTGSEDFKISLELKDNTATKDFITQTDALYKNFVELKWLTEGIIDFLDKRWMDISSCRKQGVAVKDKLSTTGFNVSEKDSFGASVDSLSTDLMNRINIILDMKHKKEDATFQMEWLGRRAFMKKHADLFQKAPDILFETIKCTDTISSASYKTEYDAINLKMTVYKNRYAQSPDSVLHQEIMFYAHKKMSVDFTTGFFFSGLTSGSYYFNNSGTVVKEGSPQYDVSLGALFSFQYLILSNLKIGPSAGAAVSFIDAKTRYMLGGSVTIGRRREFAISAGWMLATIPVPSNVINQTFTRTPSTAVPTVNDFKWGSFVGLSYSIFSKPNGGK